MQAKHGSGLWNRTRSTSARSRSSHRSSGRQGLPALPIPVPELDRRHLPNRGRTTYRSPIRCRLPWRKLQVTVMRKSVLVHASWHVVRIVHLIKLNCVAYLTRSYANGSITRATCSAPADLGLLDWLPQGHIDLSSLPDDQQRRIYDAFHLGLRYNALTREVSIRVSITGDTAPVLAATIDSIIGEHSETDTPGSRSVSCGKSGRRGCRGCFACTQQHFGRT
jgi:hypothetical protein